VDSLLEISVPSFAPAARYRGCSSCSRRHEIFPLTQFTDAATGGGLLFAFHGALFKEVAASAPQATGAGYLFIVGLHMAEILLNLCVRPAPGPVYLNLHVIWVGLENLSISKDML